MNSSKVYFTGLRTKPGNSLLEKLSRLVSKAGFDQIDCENKFVAVKIHFGEPGNLSYIRPNYAAVIVKMIQERGGKPFLTDTNTLYRGKRANAVDHPNSAMKNGFNRIAVGCDIIIGDGLKGTEFREIPIHLKHCQKTKIGTTLADADIIISMTHF